MTLDRLLELAENRGEIDTEELSEELEILTGQFPHFGLLIHFVNDLEKRLEDTYLLTGSELDELVCNYRLEWKDTQDRASEELIKAVEFNGKNILLHSNSSALQNLFGKLKKEVRKPVIWQTYSSPAGEGRVQADLLSEMGFEVNLFHEDAFGRFAGEIDFAVFGADIVVEDRFMNKTGTFPLALMCRHFNKEVYLLAERRKVFKTTALKVNALNEDLKPEK
jgi:translation initiation factor 2B subunit (eIF-2B alpha/beta/delta family)